MALLFSPLTFPHLIKNLSLFLTFGLVTIDIENYIYTNSCVKTVCINQPINQSINQSIDKLIKNYSRQKKYMQHNPGIKHK